MESPFFKDPLENVIAHIPAETGTYLGSPSITRAGDGSLIISHDYFGPGSPRDAFGREFRTSIYRSTDEKTWERTADIDGAFWSSLFEHRGSVYLLGCSAHYGDIVIRRSDDLGFSWTEPADPDSGMLFRGGEAIQPPNYHCASMPVVEFKGRVFRACEDNFAGRWAYFKSFVISAPSGSDLLRASLWRMTNQIPYDTGTDPPGFSPETAGWLEGNVVVAPDGGLRNVLRVNSVPLANKAAIADVSEDGRRMSFDPATGFIDFPGGMSKFTIRRDPVTSLYLTLSNEVTNPKNPWQRNLLVLASSDDLVHWKRNRVLLYVHQDENLVKKQCKIGFQYVDWIFDGDDILVLVRTAFRGAHNFHDANHITYHRLRGYSGLLS